VSFEDNVERFLTVSSSHVTPNDFNLMLSPAGYGLMMFEEKTGEAGVIVYVGYLEASDFDREYLAGLKFSDYFLDLIDWALENKIDWLRIVSHGTEIEGLAQCTWE
jgi:hypothetical protein